MDNYTRKDIHIPKLKFWGETESDELLRNQIPFIATDPSFSEEECSRQFMLTQMALNCSEQCCFHNARKVSSWWHQARHTLQTSSPVRQQGEVSQGWNRHGNVGPHVSLSIDHPQSMQGYKCVLLLRVTGGRDRHSHSWWGRVSRRCGQSVHLVASTRYHSDESTVRHPHPTTVSCQRISQTLWSAFKALFRYKIFLVRVL